MFSVIAEQFLGNCIMDFKKIDFIKLKEKLMGNKLRKKKKGELKAGNSFK